MFILLPPTLLAEVLALTSKIKEPACISVFIFRSYSYLHSVSDDFLPLALPWLKSWPFSSNVNEPVCLSSESHMTHSNMSVLYSINEKVFIDIPTELLGWYLKVPPLNRLSLIHTKSWMRLVCSNFIPILLLLIKRLRRNIIRFRINRLLVKHSEKHPGRVRLNSARSDFTLLMHDDQLA